MKARFSRRLAGARSSQHKVAPAERITVTLSVSATRDVSQAVLVDNYPTSWTLADAGGGQAQSLGRQSRIEWAIGDLAAGAVVTRSYVLTSPALQRRPATYKFTAALESTAPEPGFVTLNSRAAGRGDLTPRAGYPLGGAPALLPERGSQPAGYPAALAVPSLVGEAGARSAGAVGSVSLGTALRQTAAAHPVVVAEPAPPVVEYLRRSTVSVGGLRYDTLSTVPPTTTTVTATASLAIPGVESTFRDAGSRAIWVSDPVPAGAEWFLANPWTFDLYVGANAPSSAVVSLAAKVYRIDVTGRAKLLYETPRSVPRGLAVGRFDEVRWSDAGLPDAMIGPGERIGVGFVAVFTGSVPSGLQALLGFDGKLTPSAVVMPIDDPVAPGTAQLSHFRIGNDTPLGAMTWKASPDVTAGPIQSGDQFRVRFQLYNNGGESFAWHPQLEWATGISGTWAAITTTGTTTDPVRIAPTSQFADGDAITAPGIVTDTWTWQNGVAYDTSNPAPVTVTLSISSYTEVEYHVQATAAVSPGAQYYFRLTDRGTALTSYAQYAAVYVQANATPGATPSGPTPTPQPNAHDVQALGLDLLTSCATCHRAHTGKGTKGLRLAWPEEQACYICHDGTAAPNVRAEFQKSSREPVEQTTLVHRSTEPAVSATFSGANRHSECEDCHNPHSIGATPHLTGTSYASGPLEGMWGIAATWSSWWSTPAYTITLPTYEYQLCLKCHSSWAYGNSPPVSPSGGFTETDQALEFNPYNSSYHPVAAVGKNPFQQQDGTSYAGSLITGFTPSSTMYCSDCHGSESPTAPRGSHGSNNPFILRGTWSSSTGAGATDGLCFVCHNYNVYANSANSTSPYDKQTGFAGGGLNLHNRHAGGTNLLTGNPVACMDCHVAVPHGWRRPALIGFTNDGAPYVTRLYTGGLTTIDTWSASGTWTAQSCGTAMGSCHSP